MPRSSRPLIPQPGGRTSLRASDIKCEVRDGVGRLLLDRPEARNAISQAMWDEIPRSIKRLEQLNPRCIVLSGEGKDLGIGADLKDVVAATESLANARAYCTRVVRALLAMAQCARPTLAIFHGAAVGGTVELALAAEARVALPDARIYLPFARLGITPDSYTSARLAQLVGDRNAQQLIARTSSVDAREALSLGLVDAVVEDVPSVLEYCDAILAGAVMTPPTLATLGSLGPADAAQLAEPMARSFLNGRVRMAAQHALDELTKSR